MKSLIGLTLLAYLTTSCFCAREFMIEDLGTNKFKQLETQRTRNNLLKSNKENDAKYCQPFAFDFIVHKNLNGNKDHYIHLQKHHARGLDSYFQVGEHLLLTLNAKEELRFELSAIAHGKFSKFSCDVEGDRATYITEEIFNKLRQAEKINFNLEGKVITYSEYGTFEKKLELSGSFSEQNMEHLHQLNF